MNQKETAIKQRREIEAAKKNLLGSGGKFGIILRNMGTPIRSQGGHCFDYTPAPDPWLLETEQGEFDPTIIHDGDENMSTGWLLNNKEDDGQAIGWLFDGLGRGMHLEIKYLSEETKLTVTYKGYLVFAELAGHLVAYAPFAEWEDMVERLFAQAAQVDKKRKKMQSQTDRKTAEREARGFIQKLRLRWGI